MTMPLTPGPARDDHDEAQMVLAWYATGRLEPDERARVEAHVNSCAACRADLAFESWLEREMRELPLDVEQGWRGLAARVQAQPRRQPRPVTPAGVRWVLAAQMAFATLLVGVAGFQLAQRPAFHALGAAPASDGDILLMLRPDTPEAEIRRLLHGAGARLVDGPTPAGAYVLRAAQPTRTAARLREQPAVLLAEPLREGDGP